TALRIRVDFSGEAEARGWLSERRIPVEEASYAADGVVLTVGWPSDIDVDLSPLASRLRGNLEILADD
ncbi:MAG TPA: IMPACT family protein, partial [Halomonas sp.]|nr:IMPACT family protein [Halomonas sp.]